MKAVGCESVEQAKTLAKSIVCSNLTKTAIAGHDANWGRILCAMGYSGAQFDPEKVDLFFESKAGKIQIIENGTAVDYSEAEATKILSETEVTAIADVKMGDKTATAWGCDLTHGYIEINAAFKDYRAGERSADKGRLYTAYPAYAGNIFPYDFRRRKCAGKSTDVCHFKENAGL